MRVEPIEKSFWNLGYSHMHSSCGQDARDKEEEECFKELLKRELEREMEKREEE